MSTIPPVTTTPAVQKSPAELATDKQNQINAAKAQLTVSTSDAYWNANVAWEADTNGIAKIFYAARWCLGFLGKDFKEECNELAIALTTPIPSAKGYGLTPQQKLDAEQAATKASEKAFYNTFKARCTLLNVGNDCEKISAYFTAAMDTLKEVVENGGVTPHTGLFAGKDAFNVSIAKAKLDAVRATCWSMIAGDMVQTYASQAAASITPSSLLKQTEDMAKVFGTDKTSRANIFSDLVTAALKKHPRAFNSNTQENNGDLGAAGLALKYASNDEREALYDKLKKEFQETLDARKARQTALVGHYDSAKNVQVKGSVTLTREAFDTAIAERKKAEAELNVQKNKAGTTRFDAVALGTASAAFLSAQAKEKTANEEYTKAFKELEVLGDISRYGRSPFNFVGKLREGSIKEMEEKLATVNAQTHDKANNLVNFYNRLSQVDVNNLSRASLADLYNACEVATN